MINSIIIRILCILSIEALKLITDYFSLFIFLFLKNQDKISATLATIANIGKIIDNLFFENAIFNSFIFLGFFINLDKLKFSQLSLLLILMKIIKLRIPLTYLT